MPDFFVKIGIIPAGDYSKNRRSVKEFVDKNVLALVYRQSAQQKDDFGGVKSQNLGIPIDTVSRFFYTDLTMDFVSLR